MCLRLVLSGVMTGSLFRTHPLYSPFENCWDGHSYSLLPLRAHVVHQGICVRKKHLRSPLPLRKFWGFCIGWTQWKSTFFRSLRPPFEIGISANKFSPNISPDIQCHVQGVGKLGATLAAFLRLLEIVRAQVSTFCAAILRFPNRFWCLWMFWKQCYIYFPKHP